MKRRFNYTQKWIAGVSTGVLVSVIIHLGILFLATIWIIVRFTPEEAIKFEPPPFIKRPKMPLKKLQIRIKKLNKPKASTRIMAEVKPLDLYEISFPDLPSNGMKEGVGSGGRSIDFMPLPTLDDVEGLFGNEKSLGNDLTVCFYDTKRTRSGRILGSNNEYCIALMRKFLRRGWDPSVFKHIYLAPKKRYASCIVMPGTPSYMAPSAFGEREAYPGNWIALYKGQLVHTEDITFRFWAVAEDSMGIRVNEEYVLTAGFIGTNPDKYESDRAFKIFASAWSPRSLDHRKYILSNDRAVVGDWIDLKAGKPKNLEIVLRDNEGSGFTAIVAVEVKGVEYERSSQGGPILPVFKTADISRDRMDMIYAELAEKEMICLTNGPIFRDY